MFYLIENLSEWSGDSYSYYREFWKENFGLGAKEESLLKTYAKIRKSYDLEVASRPENPESRRGPFPYYKNHFRLGYKWPAIFCASRSLEEVFGRMENILSDGDLLELKKVFQHFDAQFRPYWEKNGLYLEKAAEDFKEKRWNDQISQYLDQAADFLQLPPALEKRYDLAFLWHPGLKFTQGVSHATQIGRLSLVQLPEGENLEFQLDVVVHEMIHDLYGSMDLKIKADFDSALLLEDAEIGLLAHQGLNEGLATALGNGLFIERHLPERFSLKAEWYSGSTDKYAKAIYPGLKKALGERKTITGYGPDLLAALRPIFKAEPEKLPAYFRNHLLLVDSKTEPLVRILHPALRVGTVAGFSAEDKADLENFRESLSSHWAEPVVVMMEPQSLKDSIAGSLDWDMSPGQISELKRKASGEPAAYILKSKRGRLFLLILGPKKELESSLPKLSRLDCCRTGQTILLRNIP